MTREAGGSGNGHGGGRGRAAWAGFVLVGLVLGALALPLTVAAEGEAHSRLRGFVRTGQYVLLIGGKSVDARIYHSRRAGVYLVLQDDDCPPILVSPRARTVQSVAADQIVERDDGNLYVLRTATIKTVGQFSLKRGDVIFRACGREVCLKANPPLLGSKYSADLLAHTPEYRRAGYRPDASVIRTLQNAANGEDDTEVLVVFGSWCSICKRYVPRWLEVEHALKKSGITFRYHGLPRPPAAWQDPAFKSTGARLLPGVLVRKNGQVVGRLSGHDSRSPEVQLKSILD